ncbi:MAG TPA: hypothetical protein DCY88_12260 [Cyanobacteria bacterium UBA11372]|nr:hypothetical protein [Cyanobacteria bacterium UBA11372]
MSDTQQSYHKYANKKKRLVNSFGNGYTGVNRIKSGCAFLLIASLVIASLVIGHTQSKYDATGNDMTLCILQEETLWLFPEIGLYSTTGVVTAVTAQRQ